MKNLPYALAALGLLAGCRSEPPSSTTVCLGLVSPVDACEDQMCMQEVQRLTLDEGSSLDCSYCDSSASGQHTGYFTFQYTSPSFVAFIKFDHPAALDWTLESMRQHALTVDGWYESYQGRIRFDEVPFEVVSFADGKLRVRFTAPVEELNYIENVLPYECSFMGTPLICTQASCHYDTHASGADGVPGELMVDLTGTTSYAP